jgi:WD40 repeat protein
MLRKWLFIPIVLMILSFAGFATKSAQQPDAGLTYQERLRLGRGSVQDVAWRPDGKAVAVAGSAGIWFYTDTFQDIAYLDAYLVGQVRWSPNGQFVAAVAKSDAANYYDGPQILQYAPIGLLLLWDASTYRLIRKISETSFEPVTAIAWSPDSNRLIGVRVDGSLTIWNAATGNALLQISEKNGPFYSAQWSPDGQQFVARSRNNSLLVVNAQTGAIDRTIDTKQTKAVHTAQWSPNGRLIASGGGDGTVQVWDSGTAALRYTQTVASSISALAWNSDSLRIAVGGQDGSVAVVLASSTKGHLITPGDHHDAIESLEWSGDRLLSASQSRVRLWFMSGVHAPLILNDHPGYMDAFSWSPNGKRLASVYRDLTIRIWDAQNGALLKTLTPIASPLADEYLPWPSIAWSPDGSRLASSDKQVRIWNPDTGELLQTLDGGRFVLWNPDGSRLATSVKLGIGIWDINKGQLLSTYDPQPYASSAAWSKDGRRIVSANDDWEFTSFTRVWNVQTNTLEHTLDAIPGAQFSPDGKWLATSNRYWLQLRDVLSGEPLINIETHARIMAWHPSGRRIATNLSRTGDINVWDTATGQPLAVIPGVHVIVFTTRDPNNRLAWGPDGHDLAAISNDGTLRVWQETGAAPVLPLGTSTASPIPTRQATQRLTPKTAPPASIVPTFREVRRMAGQRSFSLELSADGQLLAHTLYNSDPVLLYQTDIYHIRSGEKRFTFGARRWSWSPDSEHIAIYDTQPNNTQLLSIKSGESHFLPVPVEYGNFLAWSHDGKWLATTSRGDNKVNIWDAKSGDLVASLSGHRARVWALAWSPDSQRLATVGYDQLMNIWDVSHPAKPQFSFFNVTGRPLWSPSGQAIAVDSDLVLVRVWNMTTGQLQATVRGHIAGAYADAWSPDETVLFTLSTDNIWWMPRKAILWNVASDSLVAQLTPKYSLGARSVWLDNAHFVFADFDETWHWQQGDGQFRLTPQSRHTPLYTFPSMSPDGGWIAVVGQVTEDKTTILIRDTKTSNALAALKGHQAPVTNMLWSRDGCIFVSADETGTIVLWEVINSEIF